MDKIVKAKLIKLSCCPCGFSLLQDGIALGTEYLVYPESANADDGFTLTCGGCGEKMRGKGSIFALSVLNPFAQPKRLPLEIFDISKGIYDRKRVQ
jgi:hypothetical protein